VSTPWQASKREYHSAVGIAIAAIILALVAASKPAWFTHPSTSQAPTDDISTSPHVTAQAAHSRHSKASHPSHPSLTTQPAKQSAAGFYIQIGAFKSQTAAERLARRAKRHGWSVSIHLRSNGLHAVWVGPEQNRRAAEALQRTIRAKLHTSSYLISSQRHG